MSRNDPKFASKLLNFIISRKFETEKYCGIIRKLNLPVKKLRSKFKIAIFSIYHCFSFVDLIFEFLSIIFFNKIF